MKSRRNHPSPGSTAGLILFALALSALSKPIRLRDGDIVPAATPTPIRSAAATPPVTGLYLIQFKQPFEPAAKKILSALNVQLLAPVPPDAFIARLDGARLDAVQSLNFVAWAGTFGAQHKIHPGLKNAAAGSPAAGSPAAGVTAWLAPAATPAELAAARALFNGVTRETKLRAGTLMRGELPASQIAALAANDAVLWIEPRSQMKLTDEVAVKTTAGVGVGHATLNQTLGFDGAGVTVAVADSGLNFGVTNSLPADLAGRAGGFFSYGTLTDASDPNGHGTHVAGLISGSGATGEADANGAWFGLGVAPGANLLVQRVFDADGNLVTHDYETLTHDAVRAGAAIGSFSWGNESAHGAYDADAMVFDALVRDADAATPGDQPDALVFSAGNSGSNSMTIASPATAKNVIAVGASQSARTNFATYSAGPEVVAEFSGRGPCADGRIKPDLVAPGTWVASLRSAAASDLMLVTNLGGTLISSNYLYLSGASQAVPQVAGAAAAFTEFFQQGHTNAAPSPALIKAALVNSAHALAGGAPPDGAEGWGRADLSALLGGRRAFDFLDQSVLLTNGAVYERQLVVNSPRQPLRVTLAYTDVPGNPAAALALVNDLDLEIVSPSGHVYRGNQFNSSGQSIADATATDSTNNVEAVNIAAPVPGQYIVRVRAASVLADAVMNTPDADQDFALVISGDIPLPGAGAVYLDRQSYTAPGQIHVSVVDAKRAASASVNVVLSSSTQSNGVIVSLPTTGAGIFSGGLATAAGGVMNDGRLHIADGDAVTASYFDPVAGSNVVATAVADLSSPSVSNVVLRTLFNRTYVSWRTSEPSAVTVFYSADTSFSQSASADFGAAQTLELTNLVAGQGYNFIVVATDAAGNVTTNDNAGAAFTFTAATPKKVLLVDSYAPDGQSPSIPASTYTNALDTAGASYEVWPVLQLGPPALKDLQPYRVVMWRVSDSIYAPLNSSTLAAGQQAMIGSYVAGGGSFFMASMQILTRLGAAPFRSDVLHVGQFLPNPDPFSHCSDCDEDFGVPSVTGLVADQIGDGVAMTLNYSNYPSEPFFGLGPDFADTFTPDTNSAPVVLESVSGKTCGLRYPRFGVGTAGRVVFLSFPLDALPEGGAAPDSRAEFLRRCLDFLAPSDSALLDSPAYTIPSAVNAEVADSRLAGAGTITAVAYSDTDTNRVAFTLEESEQPGIFDGSFALAAASNAPASGTVRAQQGDTVYVDYFDASVAATLRATAVVDTVTPVISAAAAAPDYESAVITWNTSKPADSQIQFGVSALLGISVYDPQLTTNHQVVLNGLATGTAYRYRIFSRDAAGNTAAADAAGTPFTFATLQPAAAPWTDNLEGAVANWQADAATNSQSTWTLGTPANGRETQAHSPTKAFGANLNGAAVSTIDASLISPGVLLAGGNVATLQFWHDADFAETSGSVVSQSGQIYAVPNASQPPVLLQTYSGATAGWQREQLDITPFIGHVVRFVWRWRVDSVNPSPHPGWLVDDISVTVSNLATGSVQITNNLWQSRFTLSGPSSHSGKGQSAAYANLPPGQYILTFGDVPFYQTPAPQTNTLAPGGSILFNGIYNFTDANSNGIADAWEQFYFGAISTNRTASTDTLGNGMTDRAKFLAGLNPTNPAALLALTASPHAPDNLRLDWPSVPDHAYRLLASTAPAGQPWIPLTGWLTAASVSGSYTLPPTNPSTYFRLEVQP